MKNKVERYPFIIVSTLLVLSIWFLLRGFLKYIGLWLIQWGKDPFVIPILVGDPLSTPFYVELVFSIVVLITMWIFSTKVQTYQKLKWRIFTGSVMYTGLIFQLLWNSSAPVVRSLIPYLYQKKEMVYIDNIALENALLANTDNLMLFLLALPLILSISTSLWLLNFCNQHWKEMIEQFKTWEYQVGVPKIAALFMSDDNKRKTSSKIRKFFDKEKQKSIPLPDIELGVNTKSGEMVVLKGKDRTLNNLIIGSIGTGKTSALVLPMINQDLHYMTYMINHFKELYTRKDYHTEKVKGSLLNGITVIEPSKDLCDNVYELVLAHGIPKEAVYYIDPTNPNTPSLNLFNAPVDKVAEMFTMVIEGVGEKQEFFFQQSQRAHLKMHIYLLMLHNPKRKLGFEHLIEMYNDVQLVARMHTALKKTIPSNIDEMTDRDERNHWLIVKGVDEWFNETYVPEKVGFGSQATEIEITDKNSPYRGDKKVIDKKSEHVVGLRNILNDIASNILMRRVLFGESDFDFDRHLEFGGILLVNSSKGELSELSDILGKFVLLSIQNAVFRRKPNVSPYHSIYVDEFPDYINESFKSFPAQSRKYKANLTVVAQTTSQLSHKYGSSFMQTLISTLRNKYLYGDTTQEDAEMFSSIYGEKSVFDEGESDQEVSPLMESPIRRTGQTYMERKMPVLSPSELIYQDAFVCAVKIVDNNKPVPAQQILANFVPREEFKKAVTTVEQESGNYWIDVRKSNLEQTDSTKQIDYQEVDKALEEVTTMEIENKNPHSDSGEPMIIDQSQFSDEELPDIIDPHELITEKEELDGLISQNTLENEVLIGEDISMHGEAGGRKEEEKLDKKSPLDTPGTNENVDSHQLEEEANALLDELFFANSVVNNTHQVKEEDDVVEKQQKRLTEKTTNKEEEEINVESANLAELDILNERQKLEQMTMTDIVEDVDSFFGSSTKTSKPQSNEKEKRLPTKSSKNEGNTNFNMSVQQESDSTRINQKANKIERDAVGVSIVPSQWSNRDVDSNLEQEVSAKIKKALKYSNAEYIGNNPASSNKTETTAATINPDNTNADIPTIDSSVVPEEPNLHEYIDYTNQYHLDEVVRNAEDISRYSTNIPTKLRDDLLKRTTEWNLDNND